MPERTRVMGFILDGFGRHLARYLDRPIKGYHPFAASDPDVLRALLRPCDVLLVEGNNHIAGVIKYLTQSTWSHAALYVGPIGERTTEDGEPLVLVEATVGEGVVGAPLSKYLGHHTRICRPVSLSADDAYRVCAYATERIGFDYDVKNIVDLLRYLFPVPMPQRWRRRLMALGSGDPTRIICSALIAQAFESVRYPVLPTAVKRIDEERANERAYRRHQEQRPGDDPESRRKRQHPRNDIPAPLRHRWRRARDPGCAAPDQHCQHPMQPDAEHDQDQQRKSDRLEHHAPERRRKHLKEGLGRSVEHFASRRRQ